MCVYSKRGAVMATSREEKLLSVFETEIPKLYNTSHVRTSQVQMAVDIAEFLHPSQKNKKILAIEAPVGTGKSLGALVPALIECSMDRVFVKNRVLYATATINLQGQLMNGEVPLLQKLKLLDTAILAKGKAHYYCHQEMKAAQLTDESIIEILSSFYESGLTGHRDELENEYGEIPNKWWEKVSLKATKKECERCNFSKTCPSFLHRSKFLNVDNELVITNHEQLIRSILNRLQDNPTSPIVPLGAGIIIIDEAHHFIENFLSQLEESVWVRNLFSAGRHKRFPRTYRREFLEMVNKLDVLLKAEAEKCESLQGRYPLPFQAITILRDIQECLKDVLAKLLIQNQTNNMFSDRSDDFSDQIENMLNIIENCLDTDMYVSWISYEESQISNIPRNFPTRFKKMIDYLAKMNKLIIMSGTLTTNGTFTNFLNQWRLLPNQVETKIVPQTFHYEKQSLVYVPEDVVDPRQQDEVWIEDQKRHCDELIRLTGGRTLILSTSKQHMQQVSESINETCTNIGVSFLLQEQAGVEQLTRQFKSNETSVLLGSGSFFSGFSVTGSALVSVVFSKLPFPVHDDPYLKLIGEGLEDDFMEEVILPQMLVKLNQGVGRLIRDIDDYGIVTILDPRIYSTNYGSLIRNDLEQKGYRFTRSLSEVSEFYQRKLTKGSEADYIPYSSDNIRIPDVLKGSTAAPVKSTVKMKETRPKRHKITEEQREFALKICKERGVNLSTRPKFGDDLYRYLVDLYYVAYKSIAPVRDHFPFKNELQRESVEKYLGEGTRSYNSQKCTDPAFGCSGNCSEHHKKEIRERIEAAGGSLERDFEGAGFCWLAIKPYDRNDEIMEICRGMSEAAAADKKNES